MNPTQPQIPDNKGKMPIMRRILLSPSLHKTSCPCILMNTHNGSYCNICALSKILNINIADDQENVANEGAKVSQIEQEFQAQVNYETNKEHSASVSSSQKDQTNIQEIPPIESIQEENKECESAAENALKEESNPSSMGKEVDQEEAFIAILTEKKKINEKIEDLERTKAEIERRDKDSTRRKEYVSKREEAAALREEAAALREEAAALREEAAALREVAVAKREAVVAQREGEVERKEQELMEAYRKLKEETQVFEESKESHEKPKDYFKNKGTSKIRLSKEKRKELETQIENLKRTAKNKNLRKWKPFKPQPKESKDH